MSETPETRCGQGVAIGAKPLAKRAKPGPAWTRSPSWATSSTTPPRLLGFQIAPCRQRSTSSKSSTMLVCQLDSLPMEPVITMMELVGARPKGSDFKSSPRQLDQPSTHVHVLQVVTSSTPCRRPAPAIQPGQQSPPGSTSPPWWNGWNGSGQRQLVTCVTSSNHHQVTSSSPSFPYREGCL